MAGVLPTRWTCRRGGPGATGVSAGGARAGRAGPTATGAPPAAGARTRAPRARRVRRVRPDAQIWSPNGSAGRHPLNGRRPLRGPSTRRLAPRGSQRGRPRAARSDPPGAGCARGACRGSPRWGPFWPPIRGSGACCLVRALAARAAPCGPPNPPRGPARARSAPPLVTARPQDACHFGRHDSDLRISPIRGGLGGGDVGKTPRQFLADWTSVGPGQPAQE
jgi:hypothetical protein